jgi:hypothetical protein
VQGDDGRLFQGAIPQFAWRDCEKSVEITDIPSEIRSTYLPNTNQERCQPKLLGKAIEITHNFDSLKFLIRSGLPSTVVVLGTVGPGYQPGCIILRVGNLAD